MNSRAFGSTWSCCLIIMAVLVAASNVSAVTTFTINGQTELEVAEAEGVLSFQADVSQAGATLEIQIYVDANGNAVIDPPDVDLLARFQPLTITDGGGDYPMDLDGVANGMIQFESKAADVLPGFSTSPFIMRIIDEDASTAQVLIHASPPEFEQSIAGQVTLETGEPIPGALVVAVSNLGYDDEPRLDPAALCLPFKRDGSAASEPGSPTSILTVTGDTGSYELPAAVGNVMVRVLPGPGFYLPDAEMPQNTEMALDALDTLFVTVEPGQDTLGVDFLLLEDNTPPTIEHEPPLEVPAYENVLLSAIIRDAESGIEAFGGGFVLEQNGPTIYFRPAGSDEPFRQRVMFPFVEGMEPYPPLLMPDDSGMTDGAMPGAFPDIPSDLPGVAPPGDMGGGGDMADSEEAFSTDMEFEEFQTWLTGYDLNVDAIEYYIVAFDRAGNSVTSPAKAPAELYTLQRTPSEFLISGRIETEEGTGVAGVPLMAAAVEMEGNYDMFWTQSRADGSYSLSIPALGIWQVTFAPPRAYYLEDPADATATVTLLRRGEKSGVGFVLIEDKDPPVIEHDPATDLVAQAVGDDVEIRARITDDSGRAFGSVTLVPLNGVLDAIPGLASPKVGEGEAVTEWSFIVPGELVRQDFGYYIVARDLAGHRTIAPEDGETNPYVVHLDPAPYQIVGRVTDPDGQPVPDLSLSFVREITDLSTEDDGGFATPPGMPGVPDPGNPDMGGLGLGDMLGDIGDMPGDIGGIFDKGGVDLPPPEEIGDRMPIIRFTQTDADGRYSVPVKPGVWHLELQRQGLVPQETLDPVTVEAEGEYELNVVVVVDDKPPVIAHTAKSEYVLGEPMIVEATVTDNSELEKVWITLYHTSNIDVDSLLANVDDAVGGDPPSEIEKALQNFSDRIQSTLMDRVGSEFCTSVPMETTDGAHYQADLQDDVVFGPLASLDEARYVIRAVDAAGNSSVSPADAPDTRYRVPISVPQSIAGQVQIDEEVFGGLDSIIVQLTGPNGTQLWSTLDVDGRYWLPAMAGENSVSVEFHPGYRVEAPDGAPYDVALEAGQHAEGYDFNLRSLYPGAGPSRPKERWVDVNDDGMVDILDLVQIGQHFGESIDATQLPAGAPNPDANGDGVVDILDLVATAQMFGTVFDATAAPPISSSLDLSMQAIPLERGRGTVTLALQIEPALPIAGLQFDLVLHSDQATLAQVRRGDLLDGEGQSSFWQSPTLQDNQASGATNVTLRPVAATGGETAGQLAVIQLRLDNDLLAHRAEITFDSLILVDTEGRRFNARVQPIQIDLESLILPEQNALLPNYPNPFNPETWIPYQIAEDAPVQLEIFDAAGKRVRSIDLGYRPAGVYASRTRAIHWDGRNDQGERVSSGLYFYSLHAGDYHAVRRMLIAK